MFRARVVPFLALLLACGPAGCEGIDWNWDTAWWKRPRRVVRPDRAQRQADRRPPPAERDEASESEPPPGRRAVHPPAVPEAPPSNVALARARPSEPKIRAFYRLYLLGESEREPTARGECHYRLNHANARACAAMLGMLYVPIGCSGSEAERYLIYEQREEFEAACRGIEMLDVTPAASVATADETRGPLRSGIALFLHLINEGAIVDRSLIEPCERRLAEAAHLPETPTIERWAAAIFAGRLLSDFRYDYAGARSYFTQARRYVKAGSVEALTADWWRADTFAQEGKAREARAAYERLVENYSTRWAQSQGVVRSAAKLKNAQGQPPR